MGGLFGLLIGVMGGLAIAVRDRAICERRPARTGRSDP